MFRGTVGVDCSQFALRDRAYRPTRTLGGLAGLVTVGPCEVVLVTGTRYDLVGCTAVIAGRDRGPLLESFEDVEEAGFVSPASRWTGPATVPGFGLPAGPGSYRLRYHARNMGPGRRGGRRGGRHRRRPSTADPARAAGAARTPQGDQHLGALPG